MSNVEISQWAPDVYLVSVPIPSPLRQVNCYLVKGSGGWTIIDTGFNVSETMATWQAAFRRLAIQPQQVERIVVTHHHPDHYGAAGPLQQWTGAPVIMHETEARMAELVWDGDKLLQDLAAFYQAHGAPADVLAEMAPAAVTLLGQVGPKPVVTPVTTDAQVPVGDRMCHAIPAPGHSPALMLLWDEGDDLLLASDMILDPISPNISLEPFTDGDPLGDYLSSLERLARMPARLTLTGHRRPIVHLAQRCGELAEHHRQRLAECLTIVTDPAAAGRNGGVQAWQVAQGLFGSVMEDPESGLFALGEAAAHLKYLALRDRLVMRQDETGVFFHPV